MAQGTLRRTEVAWAGGLFEGEGCFTLTTNTSVHAEKTYTYVYPRAELRTTDHDVIEHFHEVIGVGKVYGPIAPKVAHHKPHWDWRTTKKDEVFVVAYMLWPHLGNRRRTKAFEMYPSAMWPQ